MTTIYVPLFYVLPLALFALLALLQGRDVMTPNTVTIVMMLLIICACFDILYGRFVATYHSKYVGVDDLGAFSKTPNDTAEPSNEIGAQPVLAGGSQDHRPHPFIPDTLVRSVPDTAKRSNKGKAQHRSVASSARITIGKHCFFLDDIRWIQSEDHYLNVHLASDSVLLLGKLSEAVAQLPVEQGLQINRSTWVAHCAIQSIECLSSRKMIATLTDGQQLKVTAMGRKLLEKSEMAIAAQ